MVRFAKYLFGLLVANLILLSGWWLLSVIQFTTSAPLTDMEMKLDDESLTAIKVKMQELQASKTDTATPARIIGDSDYSAAFSFSDGEDIKWWKLTLDKNILYLHCVPGNIIDLRSALRFLKSYNDTNSRVFDGALPTCSISYIFKSLLCNSGYVLFPAVIVIILNICVFCAFLLITTLLYSGKKSLRFLSERSNK